MSGRIELAAQELVDRHGEGTLEVAKERVELLKRSGKQPDLDLAMLVLTYCLPKKMGTKGVYITY